MSQFYQQVLSVHAIHPKVRMTMPKGVVIRQRESAQGTLAFLFNYKREAQSIDLQNHTLRDLATGALLSGHVDLNPYASHVCVVDI